MNLCVFFFMFNIVSSQVHGASCHRLPWGNPSIWLHFHWNVSHAVRHVSHAVGMWYGELCSRWHLSSYFSSGTLSSHLFGPTKFTMCTASWCWSWSSYASWPCVSPLCAHTSCSTLRTTDGECCHEIKCLSSEKHGLWTSWFCLLYSRQWTSFLSAASTAVYVYMYSFYYYFFKTK